MENNNMVHLAMIKNTHEDTQRTIEYWEGIPIMFPLNLVYIYT